MTYQEALAYLYTFSNFEHTGKFSRDAEDNLRRMRALLTLLGDPQSAYATTHIAGTKGKGSTAILIASALQASGIAVGLYSQPDLHTFRERIQIDGHLISEEDVAALMPEIQRAVAQMDPQDAAALITFEIGTALAFLAFACHRVTHAVIETGLGGRLDATNIVAPLVGVITAISYDHTAILGNTLAAIAREKAGIIKPGMTVVTSAQDEQAIGVITATCAAQGAALIRVGPASTRDESKKCPEEAESIDDQGMHQAHHDAPRSSQTASGMTLEEAQRDLPAVYAYTYPATEHTPWQIRDPDHLLPPPFIIQSPMGPRQVQIRLLGAHQRQNATAALAALDALRAQGVPITETGIVDGFRAARWAARMDVVGSRPWLVVDGAHNADSMEKLLAALTTNFAFAKLLIVLGTLRDKDIPGMAAVITRHHARLRALITTQGSSPRAMPADQLASFFAADLAPVVLPSIVPALMAAQAQADPTDLICVTGSLYLAGEALRWIKASSTDPLANQIVIAGNDHV